MGRGDNVASDADTRVISPIVVRTWSMTCVPCAPSHPPPCAASSHHAGTSAAGSLSVGSCSANSMKRGSPIAPDRTVRVSNAWPVANRNSVPSRWTTPAASAARTSSRASARSRANGFSHSTCLPAATASSTTSACACGGVVTATTSTSSRAERFGAVGRRVRDAEQLGAGRGLVGVTTDERAHLDARGLQRTRVGDHTEAGSDDGSTEGRAHALMLPDPENRSARVPPLAYRPRSAIRLGRPSCAPRSTTSRR